MSLTEDAIRIVNEWYGSLKRFSGHLPAKGAILAALHVLGRLRKDYVLDIDAHVTVNGAQITGLSKEAERHVLNEFGEIRSLTSVGGRSNRGARGNVAKLLDAMRPLSLDAQPAKAREAVLKAMQQYIVENYIGLYFAAKRVKALFDPASATARFIESILENARQNGKAGAVAEYLVGAKLAVRFPDKEIRNKRFSVSDAQTGFSGDFEIGNTVFHVTMAPMPELIEKLKGNLERGLRVYLIVPKSQVVGAEQNAALIASGRIAVASIECFIGTNIDELSEFDGDKLKSGFKRLLETYNARVNEIELDKSLLIDIPPNLE